MSALEQEVKNKILEYLAKMPISSASTLLKHAEAYELVTRKGEYD